MATQEIVCTGQSDSSSFSLSPGRVHITASRASSSDSAEQRQADGRIRVLPTIKFAWTQQFYNGHLVASHHCLPLVAYTLKAVRSSHDEGVVRVFNSKTAAKALIKGYASRVVDIAFAHIDDVPMLASVDGHGTLHVDLIQEKQGSESLFPRRLLTVTRGDAGHLSEYHRLAWCPYIADADDDDEDEDDDGEELNGGPNGNDADSRRNAKARLLAVTHDNELNLLDVHRLVGAFAGQSVDSRDLSDHFVKFESHNQPIMDLAISPEGGLMATCGLDGVVYFFQVEWEDGLLQASQMPNPWKPHEGRPVYRIMFLDDLRGVKKDVQFCSHAITCGEFNREVKLWRTDNWACRQTLEFASPAGDRQPELKLACDASGRYIVLTDTTRSVFYITEFCPDAEGAAAGPALVCLTEFVIADPCIDFAVASLKPSKSASSAQTLHLQTVGPRALQNHFITFGPSSSASGAGPASPAAAASSSAGPASAAATPRSLGNSTDVDLLLASGSSAGGASGSVGFGRVGTAVDSSTVTIVTGLASPVGSSVVGASRDVAPPQLADAAADAPAVVEAGADADADEPAEDDAEVSQLMSAAAASADDTIDMPPAPPTNGDEEDDANAIEPDEDDEDEEQDDDDDDEEVAAEAPPSVRQRDDDLLILPDSPEENNDEEGGRAGEDEEEEDTEEDGCVEEDDERAAAVAGLASVDCAAGDHHRLDSSALAAAVASAASSAAASAVGSAVDDLRQLADASRLQSQQLAELQRQVSSQAAQLALLADQHRQAERQLRSDQQETLAGVRQAALTSLDRMQQEVKDEVRRELSATNAAVQDNITKFIRSRGTVDTIGKATAQCVQGTLINAYKDMCSNLLFPRLEQMSQQLFAQLNSAFSAGLTELLAKVREETEAIAREQTLVKNKEISSLKAACSDVKADLRSTAESIRKEVDASLARLSDQQQQQQRQFLEQHQRLMQEQQQMFQQQMQQQMQQLFQQQQQQQEQHQHQQRMALRSTLVTPVPMKQPEQRRLEEYRDAVYSALAARDFNRAFKEALSSTKLELVVELCSRVNPSDLFRSPNLEQQVILSLIQQLGRNLLERTKLKCDFLQESFDYLRPQESVVREHGKRVLQHLVKRIDELNSDAGDEFAHRTVRRVRMLAVGFINEHLL